MREFRDGSVRELRDGSQKTIHYEISGAGRIDYQYNPASIEGAQRDVHGVVKILTIDLGNH
jgi:hypothetical protein